MVAVAGANTIPWKVGYCGRADWLAALRIARPVDASTSSGNIVEDPSELVGENSVLCKEGEGNIGEPDTDEG